MDCFRIAQADMLAHPAARAEVRIDNGILPLFQFDGFPVLRTGPVTRLTIIIPAGNAQAGIDYSNSHTNLLFGFRKHSSSGSIR